MVEIIEKEAPVIFNSYFFSCSGSVVADFWGKQECFVYYGTVVLTLVILLLFGINAGL